MGYEFTVYPYYADMQCVQLNTKSEKIAKELNFIGLTDSYNEPYYCQAVKIAELEKLWEERRPANYNLPMPNGLSEYEEIELPSEWFYFLMPFLIE